MLSGSIRSRCLLASLFFLALATGLFAQVSIPPQLLSGERAAALHIDQETLALRFGTELERCRVDHGEGYDRVTCLLIEGMTDCFSGRRESGLATLAEAAQTLQVMDDRLGVVLVHLVTAEAERQTGHPEEAIAVYRRAVTAVEELSSSSERLTVESFTLFARLSGFPEAMLEQFLAMASMMRPFLVHLAEAMVRDGFATLLLAERQPAKAEEQLEKALRSSQALFGLLDAQILDHLGQVKERQEKLAEARSSFELAIAATERTGDLVRRFGALRRKAEVEIALDLSEQARATFGAARATARELGDLSREARLLNDIVDFFYGRGDVEAAKATIEEALGLADRSGDDWAQVMTRFNAGALSMVTGEYEPAVRYLESAMSILDGMEAWRDEVVVMKINGLLHLSEVYLQLGRRQLMSERARAARALTATVDFPEAEALSRVLEAWDRFLDAADDPQQESSEVRRALAELGRVLARSDVLTLRSFSSTFESTIGKFSQVLEPATEPATGGATEAGGSHGLSPFGAQYASTLAAAIRAAEEGRFDEARRHFEELLVNLRAAENRDLEALVLAALASVSWRLGDLGQAVDRALEALDVLEALVGGMRVDDLMVSFLGSDRRWLYDLAVRLLQDTGKAEQAFEVAERARSRALLYQLGNQRLRVKGGGVSRQLERLRSEILALDRRAQASLAEKRAEYDELLIRAKLEDAEYADLVQVAPLDLATLQRDVLPPGTTLVAFYMLSDRVLAWLVDRETIRSFRLPLEPEDLRGLSAFADRFALGPTRGARRVEEGEDLRALEATYFERLIAPLLPHARNDKWILVPHRVLHYVPFAALREARSDRRLVEMKTLSHAPSASVLRFLSGKASPFEGRALVMGDPKLGEVDSGLRDLPWARREARRVAALFGVEPLLGADATESRLHRLGGSIDLLHVAAHGVYRPLTPRFSHLVLTAGDGENGLLEVEEIFSRLDLQGVDLVTLSACSTALGERTEGDEIIGLTRAFLYAGSPAVVSTLWQVDDEATSFLMTSFYRHLEAGTPYAEALQRAQIETSRQYEWSDPYFWAAFTLTGDAGLSWELSEDEIPSEATP